MSDNLPIPNTPYSTGTDEIGGIHYQRVKIVTGVDGTATDVNVNTPMPVSITNLLTDQEQLDTATPETIRIVGNPDGDYPDTDLLEALINPESGLRLQTEVVNPLKSDVQRAQILSDAPAPIVIQAAVGTNVIIDTTGYQSLNITTLAYAGTVFASDDGVTWSALSGITRAISTLPVNAVTAGAGFSYPCIARYIRFTCTTAGSAIAYLRNQPWTGNYLTNTQVGLNQIAGIAPVTGGVAGTLAVGGNVAVGAAQTNNPIVVGGVDSGALTRRILTDTGGRVNTSPALDPQATQRQLGVSAPVSNSLNTPVLNVLETSITEGQSIPQLLLAILTEMQIMNHQLFELPKFLNGGSAPTDEPAQFRNDSNFFNQ